MFFIHFFPAATGILLLPVVVCAPFLYHFISSAVVNVIVAILCLYDAGTAAVIFFLLC